MNVQEIQIALQSPEEEIRRSALAELRKFPLPESFSHIVLAMGDQSWRVRKEAVELLVGSSPDERRLEEVLELLRSDENAGLRNSAAEVLIRLGSLAAIPLINRINDSDPDVRKVVVDVMGAIGDPLFVPQLRNALNDQDINVASAAAEQLGAVGDPRVIPDLLQALMTQENVLFRFSVLGALGVLAAPAPVPAELLKLAEQEMLRKAVFDCLGSISDASSSQLLLAGLGSRQASSRASALKALFKIFRRSGAEARQKINDTVATLKGSSLAPALFDLFNNQDTILTEALIWVGSTSGDVRSLPLIIEASSDERYTKDALAALKNFGHEALTEMMAGYAELDENGRRTICSLIGECGYVSYGTLVTGALNDSAASVRKAAAIATGKLGLVASIQSLVALIDDNSQDVSNAAVTALRELSIIERHSLIEAAFHFSDSDVSRHRQVATTLLATLGERDRLILLAKDADPLVRKSAVAAIGAIRHESTAAVLTRALVDEDPDVRIAVAEALGESGNCDVLDPLEYALADDDVWVQCAVLRAIAKLSVERVQTIITRVSADAEGLLMITCLQLLEEIGGEAAETIIRAALSCKDPDVARQSALSLKRSFAGGSNG
ncbi:MAG TPA: HEAT repeat domain-containing protein [Desulfuromonadales bacterium]|nr:HEAT repeat domain-containing protein [Desulfuromonadales bacterium]